eukprot:5817574-Alexandrium_andersonii.AAC.1
MVSCVYMDSNTRAAALRQFLAPARGAAASRDTSNQCLRHARGAIRQVRECAESTFAYLLLTM